MSSSDFVLNVKGWANFDGGQVWIQGVLNTQGVLCNGVMSIDNEAFAKKIGINVESITANYVLDVSGNSRLSSSNSVNDYTLLNLLLASLKRRIIVEVNTAKELITNTN